jgi:hypothetical protein
MTATTINPSTGVEYFTEGPQEGQSVALYVAVTNGQVRNPNGVRWPFLFGGEHDQAADYYERVPFTSVPYDPELFVVDSENSGWGLHPARNAHGEFIAVPDGHPKGEYKYTETIKRRSVAELKTLAKGYADRYNAQLWPQENGYTEKLQYAKEQVAANNNLAQFTSLIARHEALLAASFHNDARLAQLYSEIEAAGETGAVDFVIGQMATAEFPEGWVNGIAE